MAQDVWIDQYRQLRSAWVRSRGVGGRGSASGAELPRMIAGDALALLGPFSQAVIRFHDNRQLKNESSLFPGLWAWHPVESMHLGAGNVMPIDYLMRGKPRVGDARKRTVKFPLTILGSPEVEIWPRIVVDLEHEHQQLMGAWQAAINYASDILRTPPVTRSLSAQEIEGYWGKLYNLVIALDVAREAPVPSDWEIAKELAVKVGQETQVVLERAAEIAGAAAAEIAETAGRVAGSAASGFFSQAGITALLVTGGAIYIALR